MNFCVDVSMLFKFVLIAVMFLNLVENVNSFKKDGKLLVIGN